jgi:hypothetical protein
MKIEGGNGKSKEDAIIIKDVNNDFEGIGIEYEWLRNTYGAQNLDWKLEEQALMPDEETNKYYDLMKIRLKSGEKINVWFDISDFYNK